MTRAEWQLGLANQGTRLMASEANWRISQVPGSHLEPLILLDLGITQLIYFRADAHFTVVCSIVFSANHVRRSESFVPPRISLHALRSLICNLIIIIIIIIIIKEVNVYSHDPSITLYLLVIYHVKSVFTL